MSEIMLHRVARALMEAGTGCEVTDWREAEWNPHIAQVLKEARAAIEAMREIPLGMVEAGNSALSSNGVDNVEDDDAAVCWQAMLDAALSQSPNSLPTPAATPTDSANHPPVESVGPNSEAQS